MTLSKTGAPKLAFLPFFAPRTALDLQALVLWRFHPTNRALPIFPPHEAHGKEVLLSVVLFSQRRRREQGLPHPQGAGQMDPSPRRLRDNLKSGGGFGL